jgi:anti-sigma-K factor RskA
VTIHVGEADTLAAAALLLDRHGEDHEALRWIVNRWKHTDRLIRSSYQSPRYNPKVWGAREVTAVCDAQGTYRWLAHWHLLIYTDNLADYLIDDALRARWQGARRVHISRIKASSTKQYWRSVARTAAYPVKAVYTAARLDGQREWLPPPLIEQVAIWRHGLPSRWSRFTMR